MNRLLSYVMSFQSFFDRENALSIVICIIIGFNVMLYVITDHVEIPSIVGRHDASGFSHEKAQQFVYFYYQLGHFPMGTLAKDIKHSKEGAQREISNRGDQLIMEYQHWSRLGEHARIWAYAPKVWITGSTHNPSIKLFNTLLFIAGLISVFIGFHKINKSFLGAIIVGLISLSPFHLYETFTHENIFGLSTSIFLLLLGLFIPMLFNRKESDLKILLLGLLSGVIIGFASEIRNSNIVLLVAIVFIYIFSKPIRFWVKGLGMIILLISFFVTKDSIRTYFSHKFQEAYEVVEKAKGHVYDGGRIEQHGIWHPIFCGLGDFDQSKDYKWNDQTAYAYAIPILNQDYGYNLVDHGKLHTGQYYDDAELYYQKFDEIPEYDKVIKEKVIADISSDPFWYVTIIIKRIIAILTFSLPFPLIGWLIFPLLYFLIKEKKWPYVILVLCGLPLSLNALIIHAGQGATFNGIFGFVVLAILIERFVAKHSVKEENRD